MEGLEIFLLNNKSRFANIYLQQTNGTTTGAPNWCSYSDITINHLYDINEKNATHFQECTCFGRYLDDCLVSWCRDTEKINDFQKMLKTWMKN